MGAWGNMKRRLKALLPASRDYIDSQAAAAESRESRIIGLLEQIDKDIRLQTKTVNSVKTYIDRELARRDEWPKLQEEHCRAAGERKLWVIKCPAPEDGRKVKWGDYPYALALKKYLERLGNYVVIQFREDWNCPMRADVVLVLRGKIPYRPDRGDEDCLYIMWNISHPEAVTVEEYELYDVVCVASKIYSDKLKEELDVPVIPLLQCTDTEEFYPGDKAAGKKYEYIFVGNTRKVVRQGIVWAAEEGLPITIYGSGWDKILSDSEKFVRGKYIENSKLGQMYRSSKVVLNDHWDDMKAYGFVNNRVFDALACGIPVISDENQELRNIFPEAVLFYNNKEEFMQCIKRVENGYDELRDLAEKQWELIRTKYSFEARASELNSIAANRESYKKGKNSNAG